MLPAGDEHGLFDGLSLCDAMDMREIGTSGGYGGMEILVVHGAEQNADRSPQYVANGDAKVSFRILRAPTGDQLNDAEAEAAKKEAAKKEAAEEEAAEQAEMKQLRARFEEAKEFADTQNGLAENEKLLKVLCAVEHHVDFYWKFEQSHGGRSTSTETVAVKYRISIRFVIGMDMVVGPTDADAPMVKILNNLCDIYTGPIVGDGGDPPDSNWKWFENFNDPEVSDIDVWLALGKKHEGSVPHWAVDTDTISSYCVLSRDPKIQSGSNESCTVNIWSNKPGRKHGNLAVDNRREDHEYDDLNLMYNTILFEKIEASINKLMTEIQHLGGPAAMTFPCLRFDNNPRGKQNTMTKWDELTVVTAEQGYIADDYVDDNIYDALLGSGEVTNDDEGDNIARSLILIMKLWRTALGSESIRPEMSSYGERQSRGRARKPASVARPRAESSNQGYPPSSPRDPSPARTGLPREDVPGGLPAWVREMGGRNGNEKDGVGAHPCATNGIDTMEGDLAPMLSIGALTPSYASAVSGKPKHIVEIQNGLRRAMYMLLGIHCAKDLIEFAFGTSDIDSPTISVDAWDNLNLQQVARALDLRVNAPSIDKLQFYPARTTDETAFWTSGVSTRRTIRTGGENIEENNWMTSYYRISPVAVERIMDKSIEMRYDVDPNALHEYEKALQAAMTARDYGQYRVKGAAFAPAEIRTSQWKTTEPSRRQKEQQIKELEAELERKKEALGGEPQPKELPAPSAPSTDQPGQRSKPGVFASIFGRRQQGANPPETGKSVSDRSETGKSVPNRRSGGRRRPRRP